MTNVQVKMQEMSRFKVWVLELRAPFFTAAVLPVLIAAAYVFWKGYSLDIGLVLLTIAGTISLHAGTNMINDYFDYKNTGDIRNTARTPFNGGSPFLVQGVLRAKQVLAASLVAFGLGGLIGLYLALTVSLWILPIGIIGGLLGMLYVEPRINLAGRGIGEIAVGLGFGPLMVLGACVVFTGSPDIMQFLMGVPIGCLILLVLYINQFPDMDADASVGKNHWVVRMGRKRARAGYPIIIGTSYAFVLLSIALGWMPLHTAIYLVTIPIAIQASKVVWGRFDDLPALVPAQAKTIQMHMLCGLLLTFGFLLGAFLPII